ncbi:MAG TPA: radical SAM/SPASM domain-containing protein [Candidatus Brocadiaceae bacterium]|nr:MAG: hypothetical protein A2Y09_05270 [Planctomycetes bacterium GWA2_39_15]
MKAKIIPGYDSNRQTLSEIIPIDTPFTLFISPSQTCNFKCVYCSQSMNANQKKQYGFSQKLQDFSLFVRLAHQAAEFPKKFKRVLLTGLGEPLTNPRIAEMVKMLAYLNVAEKYEVFTNASLLTPELSKKLIEAGLTGLRISVQGLTAKKYKEICGVNIDFDTFVERIRFFYQNKGNCTVYIKIIDECLEGEQEREKFFKIFGDICDDIFVENLVKAQPMMGDYDGKVSNTKTFYGETAEKREVCPYMFYTLQTDSVGNAFPCPPLGLPHSFSLGNIEEKSLMEIWNGEKLKKLRISHLRKNNSKAAVCKQCTCYKAFTPKEDDLDASADVILSRITTDKLKSCQG